MDDETTLRSEFDAEHADFIALTRSLSADQWAEPSLCSGWTERRRSMAWHVHRDRKAVVGFLLRAQFRVPVKQGRIRSLGMETGLTTV